MERRLQQAPFAAVNEETILQPTAQIDARAVSAPARSEGSERASAAVCSPKREIVAGSGPHLTKETQALLRSRLRAAAFILLIGFGVFLVRHVVGVLTGEPLSSVLLGFHILVVLVLAFSAAPLCRQCVYSMAKLRVSELVIFGLPAAFFLMLQHRVMLQDANRGVIPQPLPFWLLLIFTYGMFIPNTWRRAALVIGAMALAPIVLMVGMVVVYPQVAQIMPPLVIVQQVLVLLVAAVASVFGTHVINSLRHEVFEAKQLGQYRLIEPLGAGGMGAVYLAEHRMLKRPCAIKLIHPEHAADPHVLARFEREVRMTARLSHWNTVEIFDYGRTDDGTFFYVMEYLPGLSLDELLERHGPLPAERVVHFMRQMCQALREAHAIGLIHRDIKPGNVFAAQRGGVYDVVKLLDFGLVKPVTEAPSARLTHEGNISGTPLYMSPEQARGQADVDARSDIYSLGAVAYALLTGRPPFEGTSPMEVMVAHIRDEAVRPSQHQPDVPADVEEVVLRCLAKKPEDRFPDVESLEGALAECGAADQWSQAHAARWWGENQSVPMRALDVAPAHN
jgi:serine/threonine-protein kinase